MNRKLNGIIAAAVLAIIGTFLLVGYVSSAEARATRGEKLVPVLVVREAIRAGTDVDALEDAVAIEHIPSKVRADGAVESLDDLEGVTAVALVPGEQLLADRFVEPSVQARGNVPAGFHEVTLSLEPQRALGGRIGPGHKVGVVASFGAEETDERPTSLLLDGVLVTSVQAVEPPPENDGDEKIGAAPSSALLVTLAVTADDLEKVVDATEHGSVWLSSSPTASSK